MATKSKTKKLYFSIEGMWLSDFARETVLEGRWERALQILVKDVNCTHEQAIKILQGRANFTGVAEIGNPKCKGLGWEDLAEDHPTAVGMRKQLDRMYGTTFNHSGIYWKPYSRVHGWGKDDYDFSREYVGALRIIDAATNESARTEVRELNKRRSMYYANKPNEDMLVIMGTDKYNVIHVLCERVGIPPIWYDVPINDPGKHLWDLQTKGKLMLPLTGAETGDIEEVPHDSLVVRREAEEARKNRSDEEVAAEARQISKEFLEAVNQAKDPATLARIEREYERRLDDLRQGAIPNDVWEQRECATKAVVAMQEKSLGERVRAQAKDHGGFMELKLYDKDGKPFNPTSIQVPKNPFLLWCLRGFRFEDYEKERPRWECVSRSGQKMLMDDPFHTDWMLGAGVPLNETYDRDYDEDKPLSLGAVVRSASFAVRSGIVQEWTGVSFVILASDTEDKWLGGKIVHPKPNEACPPGSIAVVPHAGPEYQLAMETACKLDPETHRHGLVISETGGKLAHLAIVGREMKCTVLMIPTALKKYKVGRSISVDMKRKKITEHI